MGVLLLQQHKKPVVSLVHDVGGEMEDEPNTHVVDRTLFMCLQQ